MHFSPQMTQHSIIKAFVTIDVKCEETVHQRTALLSIVA